MKAQKLAMGGQEKEHLKKLFIKQMSPGNIPFGMVTVVIVLYI